MHPVWTIVPDWEYLISTVGTVSTYTYRKQYDVVLLNPMYGVRTVPYLPYGPSVGWLVR
jgi:hypothetical protein